MIHENKQRSDFLSDGYTESGYVAAVEGMYGPLRFEYRPLLPEAQAILLTTFEKMSLDAYKRKCAATMAEQILGWDLRDASGKEVNVSAHNLLRVRPALFNRLFNITAGIEATDRDPQWTHEQADDAATDQYETALSEADSIGNASTERHAKN